MRYAYNGRFRGNQQPAYGHIEARNSSEAIDALADQGIIGVLTVRPDPLPVTAVRPQQPEILSAGLAAELQQTIAQVSKVLRHTERLLHQPRVPLGKQTSSRPVEIEQNAPH